MAVLIDNNDKLRTARSSERITTHVISIMAPVDSTTSRSSPSWASMSTRFDLTFKLIPNVPIHLTSIVECQSSIVVNL